ncbi:LPXTG cell wall anchor domain-containing protein [Listeria monocytogenes]|nr:LPXTG cell wall anchor domain-containing protein [Listeria monocytogenes]EAE8622814.1 LPXTG cell wall anchor domain-containing protein [Listeria monocytogenes]EAE8627771.1 LPXTG cell wall anchor domain-containing protein [Listeria monocytogenes]EAE8632669.1 LPXTG cell wall anchor domain-containing protein [Listeria monocytogenes]EAE8633157.1 LPXTG cell wall anchor domain-containing protein [Listeria monocytogenes]
MSIKSKIIKVGICGVMVMVPLSQVSFPSFAAEEVGVEAGQDIVNIPDPELKRVLNASIEQASDADITEAQLAKFKNLSLNTGITDLTGLEYLKNVEVLQLDNINASYEPIKSLVNLKTLTINGKNVTSDKIPDLSGLSNLTSLEVTQTSIDNAALSKFSNIPNLGKLNISENTGITKISNLENLPNLQELNVTNCQINDFRGIAEFPSLTSFYGGNQRFGFDSFETDGFKNIKSSELTFDAAAQTLFIPFSIVPDTTVLNYDGTPLPVNTSPDYTNIGLGDSSYVVSDDKTSNNQQGMTLSGFSQADFDSLTVFELVVGLDGENITKPANLANGTYDLKQIASYRAFSVDHSVNITAEDNISYIQGDAVTPEKFLTDIKADANGGTITSDFAEKVDFTKPGTYTVTLNASNTAGLKAEPVQVTVTVIEKTVITAEAEVSYDMNATKSEADFLADIKAATNDGTAITTDFATAVDLTKAGEYTVTLNAENDNQKATALKVTVKVKDTTPVPDPTPTPDPDPTPTPDPDPTPEPSADPGTDPAEGPIYSADSSDSVEEPSASSEVKKSSDPILFFSASPAPKSTTKTLPKTGDSLPTTGVVAGFLVLGLGVLVARKK